MKLSDRFWLWGHNPGSHHKSADAKKYWRLPGTNKMDSAEGANYLGIKNICRVVFDGMPPPPFDAETEKLRFADQIVWSAVGDAGSTRNDNAGTDLEEVLRQAEKYPNVTGAILDDFFTGLKPDGKVARQSVDAIRAMRDQLHSFHLRPLDLWAVWYKQGLDWPVKEYLELFDVITYWNMQAPQGFSEIEDDFASVIRQTPRKRRLAGCYMWNYGEGKPLTIPDIKSHCETYYNWIKRGDAEGIIFLSNNCVDLGLEAVEWIRDWIREVGNESL